MAHTPPPTLAALSASRQRISVALTIVTMVVYFGFILLVAFDKPLLARELTPGLSLGILLGALVILASWVLVWIYAEWSNRHYDANIDRLRAERRS